jgi:hypothetical protein
VDQSRARTGAALAAIGGVVLVLSLFLDWYQLQLPSQGGQDRPGPTFDAWAGLGRTDVLLLAVGIAAVACAVLLYGGWVRRSNLVQAAVLLLGLGAVVLVLYRGLNAPTRVIFGVELETTLQIGWFVAVLASGMIAVGGGAAIDRRSPQP